jgi:saccharopine dehydrogenase-like NADP-dependent oxidoreductase
VTERGLTVLAFGATGAMGRRVASELGRSREVERVIVVGRSRAELDEVHGLLGGPRGKAESVLLRSPSATDLSTLFGRADVVASCAGPAGPLELQLVEAAITARVPYTSLCDDARATNAILGLDVSARAGAPTIVLGCGLRPGLTNLLFELAATEMDAVTSASIAVAGSVASEDGPASELHFLTALDDKATVVSEGDIDDDPAGSAPHLVYFPDPVGWVETFRCTHPEVFTLARAHPGMQNLAWHFGLAEKPAMDALRAGAALGFARSGGRQRNWLRMWGPVRPLLERFGSGRGGWTAARVDVWGTAGGRAAEVSLAVVDHLSNLASVPLAYVAIELGSRRIERPGIWSAGEALDAATVLAYLARRGVRIARLEPAVV